MENRERLTRFFEAENQRDWIAYAAFLHPDIEWVLIQNRETRIIRGRRAYLRTIKAAYAGNEDSFICEALYSGESGDCITTVLRNNHEQLSTDIFEFENGLIRKEWEFLLG